MSSREFSFRYSKGLFLITIPYLPHYTNVRTGDELGKLFFESPYGFAFTIGLWQFFLGERRYSLPIAGWLLGKVERRVDELGELEIFRTGDGRFVMQRQRHYDWYPRWSFRTNVEVGYRVLESPFELDHCNFFTLDDPLKIASNCRRAAATVREMRDEFEQSLNKE